MASSGSRSSLCHCSARSAVHVHCFCTICNGKAVNYRTQISHLTSSVFFETEIPRDAEPIGGKAIALCTCATISQTSGPGCSKVGLDNSGLVRNLNSDKTVKEKFSLIRSVYNLIHG